MTRITQGFTLVEMLVVVAIVATLVAIAIPQYQSFVLRAQLSRGYAELTQLKKAAEVCEADGNTQTECVADTIDSNMLITLPTVSFEPASIHAVFGRNASPRLKGGTIALTRQDNGQWTCSLSVENLDVRLYPRGCQ